VCSSDLGEGGERGLLKFVVGIRRTFPTLSI
jgi:hypothetical protein